MECGLRKWRIPSSILSCEAPSGKHRWGSWPCHPSSSSLWKTEPSLSQKLLNIIIPLPKSKPFSLFVVSLLSRFQKLGKNTNNTGPFTHPLMFVIIIRILNNNVLEWGEMKPGPNKARPTNTIVCSSAYPFRFFL